MIIISVEAISLRELLSPCQSFTVIGTKPIVLLFLSKDCIIQVAKKPEFAWLCRFTFPIKNKLWTMSHINKLKKIMLDRDAICKLKLEKLTKLALMLRSLPSSKLPRYCQIKSWSTAEVSLFHEIKCRRRFDDLCRGLGQHFDRLLTMDCRVAFAKYCERGILSSRDLFGRRGTLNFQRFQHQR